MVHEGEEIVVSEAEQQAIERVIDFVIIIVGKFGFQ